MPFTTDDVSTWDRGRVKFTTVEDSNSNDSVTKEDIRDGSEQGERQFAVLQDSGKGLEGVAIP